MIKRGGQERIENRKIAEGNGEIMLKHIFEKDEMFGKSRLCAELVVEPGCSIGQHAHAGEIEIFHMLEGELVSVNADGSEEPFREGDTMVTGGGGTHCLRNDAGKKAVMLAVIAI